MGKNDYIHWEETSLLQDIVDAFGVFAIAFSWIYFCFHYYGPIIK